MSNFVFYDFETSSSNKFWGQIIEIGERIVVSTGNGSIELLSLQVEDEPTCNANLFSKSYDLEKNNFFNDTLGSLISNNVS